jgi:hypothetical protein
LKQKLSHFIKKSKNVYFRIEIYFDHVSTRKHIQQLDFTEVNWYLNGVPVRNAQRYHTHKQGELATLEIKHFNLPDCGVYGIQVMGKSGHHYVATLNIEC